MSEQADTITPLIQTFGLSAEESKIYLYLLKHGFSSALVLSRQLSIARTKIYRLIDKLKAKGFVEQKLDDRGMRFGAVHPTVFEHIAAKQEEVSRSMQKKLPQLTLKLQSLMQSNHHDSKVLYYEGVVGLKQVSYNITKATDSIRVFEMAHSLNFCQSISRKAFVRNSSSKTLPPLT